MSSDGYIPAYADRDSRVWLDTGDTHPKTGEPIIELLNGEARGALSWVIGSFGPLQNLSIHTMNKARRRAGSS